MLHPFEQHIQSNIERLKLLRRSSPVLVALSGGADSVALLAALTALGYDTIAAHCNFRLRGAESTRDMRHAEAVARELGVNIYIKDFDVPERMKQTGESLEMACRELRYAWFDALLDRDNSQAVAVAHHREDNVETFFLNLLRSGGMTGLSGMPWRRDYVVRPMLDVSRAEIETYLADRGLRYVTDSSNASSDFVRNRLRNIVIPTLEQAFPGASEAILASMSHLSESRMLVDDAVNVWRERIGATAAHIDVGELARKAGIMRAKTVLFEMLKERGFNPTQTTGMVDAAVAGRSGRHFDAAGFVAELDRGVLTLTSRITGHTTTGEVCHSVCLTRDILTPVNIEVSEHDVVEFHPERDARTVYFDRRILDGNPVFSLRHPRRGDRIAPFGLPGDKLVSRLMKDARFAAANKRDTWILTRNDEVLWVVGLRASRRFSLTPDTRRYLKLTWHP